MARNEDFVGNPEGDCGGHPRGAPPRETTREVRGLRHDACSSRCEVSALLFVVFGVHCIGWMLNRKEDTH